MSGTAGDGLVLHLGDGSGDPYDGLAGIAFGRTGETITAIALGDLDNDGDLDVVAAAAGALYWYKNDGRGRFDAGTLIAGVTDAVFALGDLNGDGKLDLVTGAKWYSGDDAGVFTDAGTVDSGTVGAIAVGDIDGDGKLDVVVTGAGRATTAYRNLAGTACSPRCRCAATGAATLAVADADGDGTLDMIVGNARHSGLWTPATVPPGTPEADIPPPTFSFVAKGTIAAITTATLTGLAFGDVDGDGRVDLVTANGTAATRVQLGTGTLASPRAPRSAPSR